MMSPLKPRRLRSVILVPPLTLVLILLPLVAWISFIFIVIFQLKPPILTDVFPTRHNENNEIIVIVHEGAGVLAPPSDLKPGEMGKPFVLPKNLTQEQKRLVSDGWTKNAFNQFVSDQISLRRSLPDVRDEWCKPRLPPPSELPMTSIIMCFHNEARSVLLRSVHSVLDRSPPELIREIILVDDFSDMDHLKAPLEKYFSSFPKVKIIRSQKRVGLIKARLLGAAQAQGPTLTFLDSHIEATTGWLEPLLERVAQNWRTVTCPVIDIIDDDTMEYREVGATSVGGFSWSLAFTWHSIPQREKDRRTHDSEPVQSPTMAGGLFSISKDFFEELGTYDPDFDIWGGENLELSFKIWMCGGILEIVPCSHVGHIFRKRSPYKWRKGVNVVRRNSVRLAKVWMDDYAQYYFQRIGYDLGEYGDISPRLKLREKLNCKSFKWYMDNVYPEQYIPGEALGQGEIRCEGMGNSTCLDSEASKKDVNEPVGLWPCHGSGGNQFWTFTKNGEIRRDDYCIDFNPGLDHGNVIIFSCGDSPNQRWSYDQNTGLLSHPLSRKCLTLRTSHRAKQKLKLTMERCDATKENQRWRFGHYNDNGVGLPIPK